MAGNSLMDEAVRLLNGYKYAIDVSSKLDNLRSLKEIICYRDPSLLRDFIPHLQELQSERFSPIRKYLAEIINEVGSRHLQYLGELVPVLIALLKDDVPPVAKQAVTSSTKLLRSSLEQVVLQGIYSDQMDNCYHDAWSWIVRLKDAVYSIAFQPGSDGIRSLAIKFVELAVLLFTSDPHSCQIPPKYSNDGMPREFNIKWIVGGHPILDITKLDQEAGINLRHLLDQLRLPAVKSLNTSIVIVLVNSLASIAKKRPSHYGKIMPVLIGLGKNFEAIQGFQNTALQNTLKNAFVAFLKCSHPGANPWREQLINSLNMINAGDAVEQALPQADRILKGTGNFPVESTHDEVTMSRASDFVREVGQKRCHGEVDSISDLDDRSKKRQQHSYQNSEDSLHREVNSTGNFSSNGICNENEVTASQMNPVEQLVAMFGAIVAQGDRALESIEILLSQVPNDLLAELVMANIPNLPATCPADEDDQKLQGKQCSPSLSSLPEISQAVSPSASIHQPLMPLTEAPQLSGANCLEQRDKEMPPVQQELHIPQWTPEPADVSSSFTSKTVAATIPSNSGFLKESSEFSRRTHNGEEVDSLANIIPGLSDKVSVDKTPEVSGSPDSSFRPPKVSDSDSIGMREASPHSQANDRSEIFNVRSSSATSICTLPSTTHPVTVAPKVIALSKEQRNLLGRVSLERILDGYKQVSTAVGCELPVPVLTKLIDQNELEFDVQEFLQAHILTENEISKGHQLTLCVLYKLYGEMVSKESLSIPSSELASLYEGFLLVVVQYLRDSFPSTDKTLIKLLVEVPFLSDSALGVLKDMCLAKSSTDRVAQGLLAIWRLIEQRPSLRAACLEIALQSAVHNNEDVRGKAIRLVANRLYPLSYLSKQIEEFAIKMMLSVTNPQQANEDADNDIARSSTKNQDPNAQSTAKERQQNNDGTGESMDVDNESVTIPSASDISNSEAQRCMSLFFALCIKKHSILKHIFAVYESAPKTVKQAVQRHIPKLIGTIKASNELLQIIANPPPQSESILILVLQKLIDGTNGTPPANLISTVKTLYETKLKDAEILIPILSSLTREEVLPVFPKLVALPLIKFHDALARILQGSTHSGPALTPAEVLIAIHGIDPEHDGIALKKLIDACSTCFEQKSVFTQQVFAQALNQLVERIPLPLLFMRTVIQTCSAFPSLVSFVMGILSRLVNKQIWRYPKLWVGFLKCAFQTKPHSFPVLLQLPSLQLENALNKYPALRPPLVAYASQPNNQRTALRSNLVSLGIIQDSQPVSTGNQNTLSTDAEPSGHITEVHVSESAVES